MIISLSILGLIARSMAFFGICSLPTLIEIWDDAKGETKKITDRFVIAGIAILIALSLSFIPSEPIPIEKTLVLCLVTHVAFFDYIITWLLRRNGVIRADAKVFDYSNGKGWDKLVSKVDWRFRIFLRAVAFIVGVLFFYI